MLAGDRRRASRSCTSAELKASNVVGQVGAAVPQVQVSSNSGVRASRCTRCAVWRSRSGMSRDPRRTRTARRNRAPPAHRRRLIRSRRRPRRCRASRRPAWSAGGSSPRLPESNANSWSQTPAQWRQHDAADGDAEARLAASRHLRGRGEGRVATSFVRVRRDGEGGPARSRCRISHLSHSAGGAVTWVKASFNGQRRGSSRGVETDEPDTAAQHGVEETRSARRARTQAQPGAEEQSLVAVQSTGAPPLLPVAPPAARRRRRPAATETSGAVTTQAATDAEPARAGGPGGTARIRRTPGSVTSDVGLARAWGTSLARAPLSRRAGEEPNDRGAHRHAARRPLFQRRDRADRVTNTTSRTRPRSSTVAFLADRGPAQSLSLRRRDFAPSVTMPSTIPVLQGDADAAEDPGRGGGRARCGQRSASAPAASKETRTRRPFSCSRTTICCSSVGSSAISKRSVRDGPDRWTWSGRRSSVSHALPSSATLTADSSFPLCVLHLEDDGRLRHLDLGEPPRAVGADEGRAHRPLQHCEACSRAARNLPEVFSDCVCS